MSKHTGLFILSILIAANNMISFQLFGMRGEEENYGPSSSSYKFSRSKSSSSLDQHSAEQDATSTKPLWNYPQNQDFTKIDRPSFGLNRKEIQERIDFSKDTELLPDQLVTSLIDTCPQKLQIIIEKFRYRHCIASCTLPKSIILVGPSGVGKSEISRAIAQDLSFDIHFVRTAFLGDEYKKSGEQDLRRLIEPLINSAEKPLFIVFDEMQSLTAGHKNKEKGSDFNVGIAFWSLIDKYKKNPNIFFIGTLNDEEDIPEQFRTRTTLIHIPLPDQKARKRIISYHLSLITNESSEVTGTVLDKSCEEAIDELSYMTSRFTGRDLVTLINNSVGFAILRSKKEKSLDDSKLSLQKDDLIEAFKSLKPEVYSHEYAQLLPWKKVGTFAQKSLPAIGLAIQGYAVYNQIVSQNESFKYQRLFNMLSMIRNLWPSWSDSKAVDVLRDFEQTSIEEAHRVHHPLLDKIETGKVKNTSLEVVLHPINTYNDYFNKSQAPQQDLAVIESITKELEETSVSKK